MTQLREKPTGQVQLYAYAMDGENATFAIYHIRLDEEIDFKLMDAALHRVSRRFSYMCKKITAEGNQLFFEPCETEVRLHHDELDYIINEQDNEGLLFRFAANGSTLIVSFFHALSDGRGMLNYIRTLLWEYFKEKNPEDTNRRPVDMPDINEAADPDEYMDPMTMVPEDIPGTPYVQQVFFQCPELTDKKLIKENRPARDIRIYHAYNFSCEGEALLDYAKASDGTPNALLAIAMAKTIWSLYPEALEKGIDISIAIDTKPITGAEKSTLPCIQCSIFHFDEKSMKMEDELLHTCVRGKVISDCDKEKMYGNINGLRVVERLFGYMKTIDAKRLLAFQSTEKPRSTGNVSYTGAVDFGSISHHIKSIYTYAEAASPMLEINYINDTFFFSLLSSFDAGQIAVQLAKECSAYGCICSEPEHKILKTKVNRHKPKLGLNSATLQMLSAVKKLK